MGKNIGLRPMYIKQIQYNLKGSDTNPLQPKENDDSLIILTRGVCYTLTTYTNLIKFGQFFKMKYNFIADLIVHFFCVYTDKASYTTSPPLYKFHQILNLATLAKEIC